ncbi:MAG: hypothetical protein ACLQJL_07570 [Roseiarcus sp.]
MNPPIQRALAAEMLAYVDDCLPQQDRRALEDRMAESPEVKRQIEQWLLQNEIVRAAFPDPPLRPSPAAGGFAAKGRVSAGAPKGAATRRETSAPERPPQAADRAVRRLRGIDARAPASAPRTGEATGRGAVGARRVLCTIAAVFVLWAAGAALPARDPSVAFVAASAAAYRTFAGAATRSVEVATADRGTLGRWFATQIGRAAPVPDLAAAGLVLLGGRIVPGAASPAQFLLYGDAAGVRIGVAIEALDSPPATDFSLGESGGALVASWTAAGHGFAVFGRASRAKIAELARLIRDGAPRN